MVDIAYAAGAAQPSGSPLAGLLPMILIFVVFYFLLIRPQQKKAKKAPNLILCINPNFQNRAFQYLLGLFIFCLTATVCLQGASMLTISIINVKLP